MKAKFLNLDPHLESARAGRRNRIYRAGLELEGGWKKLPAGTNLVHDGSVRIPEAAVEAIHTGELNSPPLEVDGTPFLTTIDKWMRTFYPSHVNETCGLHVHMSFKNALMYQRVMDEAFPATIVEYFRRWGTAEALPAAHPLWPRVGGKSSYCQHKFYADQQAMTAHKGHDRNADGHRYTVINYCYTMHQTVECRLLPMFSDVGMAMKAIKELLAITNAYLVASAKREPKVDASVIVDDNGYVEHMREAV